MAIVISSLTPTNPTTASGGSVQFNINATDDGGLTLSYEWQYSIDGVNYSSSGLSNNTSASYNTGPLTISQNGIYYRCVVSNVNGSVNSNEYPGIGDRTVIVFQDPSIIIEVDSTVDFLPASQVKTVGDNLVLTISSSLLNADVSNNTLVSNIQFLWQKSQDSGSTWTNISVGGNVSITEQTALINDTTTYMKYSTLIIQNISYNDNLNLYRVRVSYTGAINTPVDSTVSQLIIDPVINIIRQPGVDASDTQITNCYKTSITNSGKVRISVSALTTVGTGLSYRWEVNFAGPAGGDDSENWLFVGDVTSRNTFILKPGTTSDTDVLELERFIYYEQPGFRCVISGANGEATVITDPHYIYMTDVQGYVNVLTTTYNIAEDKYGDIVDRDIYVNDTIQTLILDAEVDIQRNTGQNGNNIFTWQRKSPGSSTWIDITDPAPVTTITSDSLVPYTQFPDTLEPDTVILTLQTPPLRRDIDDGAKYRVKVESSSLFTLNGNNKTIIPYYSPEITINVYRTVYITNQPISSNEYPNYSTSFSVSAIPSSGNASDITYQWQYNTVNSTSGWVNIQNNFPYSGNTTNLLTINPVLSTNPYPFFRCVLNITNGLSSITTGVARLTIIRDYFTSLSSINDVVLREFDTHTFSVTASSVSVGPISYQWQKSNNFNPANSTGTWSNIPGETTSNLVFLSIANADDAYYRVKCTSSGGEILYSNSAKLTVKEVNITILQNIVTSISVLEGEQAAYRFICEGFSSINTEVAYEWQIKRIGDSDFTNIGTGYNNSADNDNEYVLRALDNAIDNGAKIRCKMSASGVPGSVYTNECNITVIRRFTYFADVPTKTVTIGNNAVIDLNPTFTGGNPTYSWEENGVTMGETGDVLVIPNVTSAYNGRVYRCKITLDGCTQHRYSRNNTVNTVTITPPTAYTVSVTLSTVAVPSEPIYYSNETAKSGAAIGTVICIPKPAGYVEDASATDDDISRWKCAQSGTAGNTTAVSTVTSGPIWSSNKPSWASSYISPKWSLSEDRFRGYIELRGQYVKALDFPNLARQWGTKFGGNITGSYPNYNSNDYFRLPNTYAKRLMGTGNVNNNSGSVSLVPLYNPDGQSGGDKNVPGSMGGQYNYVKSAQLPPGSPGVSGEPDGTADGFINAQTFSIGSFKTTGMSEVSAFAQPSFSGSVSYFVDSPSTAFTDLPEHNHTAVSVGWIESTPMITGECAQASYDKLNPDGPFHVTEPDSGILDDSYTTEGADHGHGIQNSGPGNFDMVVDAGMGISDTTLRFTSANDSIMNNNLRFTLKNNEQIPLNAPYFRLKYMVKAY